MIQTQHKLGENEKRGRGRPRKEITRVKIGLRLEPKELQFLKQLAREMNCTLTEAVRCLIIWDGPIDVELIKTRLERIKMAN